MRLPPFLLDEWIAQKHSANPPIEFDLASSTGPAWTLRELMALAGGDEIDRWMDSRVFYSTAAGNANLRAAIAALEGVDPIEVQVVTGGSEALLILFFLTADPGANVLLPQPGFPANGAIAGSLGLELRYYHQRASDGFAIDLDEIRKLTDSHTKLLLVNSPHNPSGAVLTDAEMEAVHDFCAQRGIQFVSDQVYHPIYHGAAMRTAARLPHATVIGDFSKALCLSGLRIGWLIEHDAARRKQYLDVRSHFTVTNSILTEHLATIALQNGHTIYGRAQAIATGNLRILDRIMSENAGVVEWRRPLGGMTAFPWLTDGSDARDFCVRLMQRGALVVPGDCFGALSHFRLGFAASGELFPAAAERFEDFLHDECKRAGCAAMGAG